MKKILIAGSKKDTKNYAEVLNYLGAEPVVSLHPESVYSFDGLILPGGGGICPSYFDQPVIDTREISSKSTRTIFFIYPP